MIGIDNDPTLGPREDCYVLVTVNPLLPSGKGGLVRPARPMATRVPRALTEAAADAGLHLRVLGLITGVALSCAPRM